MRRMPDDKFIALRADLSVVVKYRFGFFYFFALGGCWVAVGGATTAAGRATLAVLSAGTSAAVGAGLTGATAFCACGAADCTG